VPFKGTAVLLYVPWAAKRLFDHLVTEEAGISLLLHALVSDVVVDSDRVEAVVVATKRGPQAVRARAFVDATGDADLVVHAGAPAEAPSTSPTWPRPPMASSKAGGWPRRRPPSSSSTCRGSPRPSSPTPRPPSACARPAGRWAATC